MTSPYARTGARLVDQGEPLDIALAYIANGWPVFPCRAQTIETYDRETGEVTELKVKTPYTSNGFKSATKVERIVRRWWQDHPDAMVGVPTGAPISAWVLDIDRKVLPDGNVINGYETLAALEEEHGALPDTRRVLTPSGGTHYFFRHVPGVRNRGAVGVGIDVRGDGGYVIAGGSVMTSGARYEWVDEDAPILDAPDWLLERVTRRQSPASESISAPRVTTNDRYVSAAVQRELDELAAVPMGGGRNVELNKSAFALGTFVAAGALGESDARAMLQDVARQWGRDWVLCRRTIENGLKAGMEHPRHIPEPEGDNTRLFDMQRMIENGRRKARERAAAQNDNHPAPEPQQPTAEPEQEPGDAKTKKKKEVGPLHATPFGWVDPTTLQRREFAFGEHYIRKYVSVTVAPGGLGKSSNSIVEALSMVSGKDLIGTKPPGKLRVWLFNAEDPRDELERRIMAACIHYKLTPDDLGDRLFVDSGREQELVIAKEDKKAGLTILEPIVEAITAEIERNRIDVMIVDPFVSTHRVSENDNGAIDAVAKMWAQIANDTNTAQEIVHHSRKTGDKEVTIEDARGAGSLVGAARSVRVLNRMTEEQATAAGISPMQRFEYFSISYGKSNLSKLSDRLDWRHLESVGLGNKVSLSKPQDFAPVVTQWKWPTSEEVRDALTPAQIEGIRVQVTNADFKESPKAKNWAGQAVAYALGLDLEDDAQRKRAGTVLRALIKEGVLVKSEEKDPVRRESATFIRAAA